MKNSILLLLFTGFTTLSFIADSGKPGKVLFEDKCQACHTLDEVRIGPPLGCIGGHLGSDWIYLWVNHSDSLITSGDLHALALKEEFHMPHPEFRLNRNQVEAIVFYLDDKCSKKKLSATNL